MMADTPMGLVEVVKVEGVVTWVTGLSTVPCKLPDVSWKG